MKLSPNAISVGKKSYSVIEMPPPVVLSHVSKCSINTTLSSNGVRPGRKELGDTSGLEARLGAAHSGTKTSAAGADDDCVVCVIHCE